VTLKPDKLLDLTARTALVTGASGGIGGAIAHRLAAAGAHIVVHYAANEPAAKKIAAAIEADGGAATPVKADITRADQVEHMFDRLEALGLSPGLIVNNAGLQPVAPLMETSVEEWRRISAVNLEGAFLVARQAARRLAAKSEEGAIVNIASIEGLDPAAGHGAYAASKAGLLMFTRAAALEFGPLGIRVNAVSPGLIHRDNIDKDWPEGVARWTSRAPLARLGAPGDVADAVLFLLSNGARWITGANLMVECPYKNDGRLRLNCVLSLKETETPGHNEMPQAPIGPSGHFPHEWGKNYPAESTSLIPPPLAGEVSAKLTEGATAPEGGRSN